MPHILIRIEFTEQLTISALKQKDANELSKNKGDDTAKFTSCFRANFKPFMANYSQNHPQALVKIAALANHLANQIARGNPPTPNTNQRVLL